MPDARIPIIFDTCVIIDAMASELMSRQASFRELQAGLAVDHAFTTFSVCLTEPTKFELLETMQAIERPTMELNRRFNYISSVINNCRLIEPGELPRRCRKDRGDDKILMAASGARAPYIVTSDNDLLSMQNVKGCLIFTPAVYNATLMKGRDPPWVDEPKNTGKRRTSRRADRKYTVRQVFGLARC